MNKIYHSFSSLLLLLSFINLSVGPICICLSESVQSQPAYNLEVINTTVLDELDSDIGPLDIIKAEQGLIGILRPFNASFTTFYSNGRLMKKFPINKVFESASEKRITGGLHINFSFKENSVAFLKSGSNNIEVFSLDGKSLSTLDFSNSVSNFSIGPGRHSSSIELDGTDYNIFSYNMTLNTDRSGLVYNPENPVFFTLDSQKSTISDLLRIKDILKTPLGEDLSFFEVRFNGEEYWVYSRNKLAVYVLDSQGNFQKTIGPFQSTLSFQSSIDVKTAGRGYGIIDVFRINETFAYVVHLPKNLQTGDSNYRLLLFNENGESQEIPLKGCRDYLGYDSGTLKLLTMEGDKYQIKFARLIKQ